MGSKHTTEQREELRRELRDLLDKFILTSRSQLIRTELSDTIVCLYVNGVIERAEYHAAMAEVA